MLFYGYFAVSILWSGDPTGSVKRLFKDFGLLFVIAILWSEKQPLEAIRSVYIRCACVLLPLSVVCDRYFPTIGKAYTIEGEPMFTGVTMQKNTLGEMVLILSLFLTWDLLESHHAGTKLWHLWDRYFLLILGLFLLRDSQSKTALLCLLIGATLTLRRGWLASRFASAIALVSALVLPYIVVFAQEYRSLIAPVVEAVGRSMTFTGRADIWEHITTHTVNPLVGAGYWNFWGGPGGKAISVAMKTVVPNAHCGYLDMYLDGGAVGLVLLGTLLIASGRKLINNTSKSSFDQLRFAILIAAIVYNLSETTFTRLSPCWFATLLAVTDFSSVTATLRGSLSFKREADPGQANTSRCHSLAGSETQWFS
jgi:O-antigen ligase